MLSGETWVGLASAVIIHLGVHLDHCYSIHGGLLAALRPLVDRGAELVHNGESRTLWDFTVERINLQIQHKLLIHDLSNVKK